MFHRLKLYRDENGHCLVPKKAGRLGMWVYNQRRGYQNLIKKKKSSMTLNRIKQLESIGFVWVVKEVNEMQWQATFRVMQKYREIHGDCLVPKRSCALGQWVYNQRKHFKRYSLGKPSFMTESHILQLESIGFVWNAKDLDNKRKWRIMFEELKRYKAEHGDCLVPARYQTNPKLGKWVRYQRLRYKAYLQGNKSCITRSHISSLESIGFVWNASRTCLKDCRTFLKDKSTLPEHISSNDVFEDSSVDESSESDMEEMTSNGYKTSTDENEGRLECTNETEESEGCLESINKTNESEGCLESINESNQAFPDGVLSVQFDFTPCKNSPLKGEWRCKACNNGLPLRDYAEIQKHMTICTKSKQFNSFHV